MTYNRPNILKATIGKLIAQTRPPDLILVVDNGSELETKSVAEDFSSSRVGYARMSGNLGPAGAAHYGLEYLIAKGYQWIYWGDDDDPPRHADTIERLLNIVSTNREEKIGAVGEVGQRFDWGKGTISRLEDSELHGCVVVDVIAGGQQFILNASAVKDVGLPRKELFFGYEEPELCLRLRRAGYKLLIDGERMKEARISAGRYGKEVKGSALDRPRESLWRHYYSTRNYIYMMRHSFSRADLAHRQASKEFVKALFSFKRGLKYGLTFSHMSLLGILHGYKDKMGKVVEPQAKK